MRLSMALPLVSSIAIGSFVACGGGSTDEAANPIVPDPTADSGSGHDGATLHPADGAAPGTDGGTADPDGAPPPPPNDGGAFVIGAHPPLPQIQKGPGSVLKTPKVVPIFFPNYDYHSEVVDLVNTIGQQPYWAASTAEYGVGPLSTGAPIDLTEAAPRHDRRQRHPDLAEKQAHRRHLRRAVRSNDLYDLLSEEHHGHPGVRTGEELRAVRRISRRLQPQWDSNRICGHPAMRCAQSPSGRRWSHGRRVSRVDRSGHRSVSPFHPRRTCPSTTTTCPGR